MTPVFDYEKWREQQMQDPEFTAELEKLEPGYQVARLRIKLGLTQAQLARLVGTKQPSIARLENGEGSPSLSFLEKVAEALGAEVKVHLVPKNAAQGVREDTGTSDYKAEVLK
jgi:transcriptional regulator with XRE-family HTH domain